MFERIQVKNQIKRILLVEKFIMMPVKAAAVFLASLLFLSSDPISLSTRHFFIYQTSLYIVANLIFYIVLLWAERRTLSVNTARITSFFLSITDNLYLSFLIFITDGCESPLYWAYCGLMVRNAVNFPKIREQGLINLALCFFYTGAVFASEHELETFAYEVFYLRLIVLILVSICCWGINILLKKRAMIQAEGREIQMREQKLNTIRRMAGDIAHELKNPLAIINTASFYLEQKIIDEDEQIMKELSIIRSEITRADLILTRLMDYSKLESAKLERLYINSGIEIILENLHPEISYPNVKIEKNFHRQLPSLLMDKGHWQQIISNVLSNALEAVSLYREDGIIKINTCLDGNQNIMIEVSDNGPGISEKNAAKIFKPFFTTKEKGTGLGLAIVKNLVETYDGELELKSKIDQGTRVFMSFPTQIIK